MSDDGSLTLALKLVAQEVGIGSGGRSRDDLARRRSRYGIGYRKQWITEIWGQVPVFSLAIACFAIAQSLHGSGYIAAFTGGILFGFFAKHDTHKLVLVAEGTSEVLAMATWIAFGTAVLGGALDYFSWSVVLYSVLSLTVIRMLPIFLSLTGTGERADSKLFLAWFGPRGLASIVFAIIVINKGVPGGRLIGLVVACTVFLSVIAHGVTANPLAARFAARLARDSAKRSRALAMPTECVLSATPLRAVGSLGARCRPLSSRDRDAGQHDAARSRRGSSRSRVRARLQPSIECAPGVRDHDEDHADHRTEAHLRSSASERKEHAAITSWPIRSRRGPERPGRSRHRSRRCQRTRPLESAFHVCEPRTG